MTMFGKVGLDFLSSIVYAALLTKTNRIQRIFNSAQKSNKQVPIWTLITNDDEVQYQIILIRMKKYKVGSVIINEKIYTIWWSMFIWLIKYDHTTFVVCQYEWNIARGTTDQGIDRETWIMFFSYNYHQFDISQKYDSSSEIWTTSQNLVEILKFGWNPEIWW